MMGIKKPPAYEHPKKRRQRDTPRKLPTAAPLDRSELAKKKENKNGGDSDRVPTNRSPVQGQETILMRVVAHAPAAGELELFDKMIESGLSEKQALLALLRQGTVHLGEVSNLSAKKRNALSYTHDGIAVETNRKIPLSTCKGLKATLDPFDALTTRGFGAKLGEILVALAAREKKFD